MPHTVWRTILGMSTYAFVVISPATTTSPVVSSVSHATRPIGSSARMASRMASETWSAILSGWPSVTDSDVNVYAVLMVRCAPCSWALPCGVGQSLRIEQPGHHIEHERRQPALG